MILNPVDTLLLHCTYILRLVLAFCLTVMRIPTRSNHTLQKVGVGCTYGCGSEKTPAFVSTAHGFKTKYAPDGALSRGAMWKGEPPPHPSPQELTSRLGRGSIQNRGCYKAAAGRSVQGEVGKTLIWIWSLGASWSGGTGIPGAHAGHTSQGAEVWNRQKPGSDGSLLVTRPQVGWRLRCSESQRRSLRGQKEAAEGW